MPPKPPRAGPGGRPGGSHQETQQHCDEPSTNGFEANASAADELQAPHGRPEAEASPFATAPVEFQPEHAAPYGDHQGQTYDPAAQPYSGAYAGGDQGQACDAAQHPYGGGGDCGGDAPAFAPHMWPDAGGPFGGPEAHMQPMPDDFSIQETYW